MRSVDPTTGELSAPTPEDFKSAKDALISSLFELSKAAGDASKSAIDFFNIVEAQQLSEHTTVEKTVVVEPTEILHIEEDVDETPKKKQKKIRDPNAPKKPMTSFFLYSNFMRNAIAKERETHGDPSLSQPELAQETSKRWSELPPSEKLLWKELYEEQKLKYDEEFQKYTAAKESGDHYAPPAKTGILLFPEALTKKAIEEDTPSKKRVIEDGEAPKKKEKKSKKKKSKDKEIKSKD